MRVIDRGIPGREDVPTPAKVTEVLRTIVDPELGLDVVGLGLVYEVEIEGQNVWVKMTMTSQACPVGPQILDGARRAITAGVPGVAKCDVQLVWDPPWKPDMMSPEARKAMGWA
ncbi:MAG: metal-sulfur cluster assembly factor [Planctomycetia bacterium]|nr:metal-sulfur cluster assembly factor [Planctomycetia bacterium]